MKNRLQKLWDETVPLRAKSPQPDPEAVLRRVDAALDGTLRQPRRRSVLRHALLLAAALLLLTGMALAAGQNGLPALNILDAQFSHGENPEMAASLVNTDQVSVSDENYLMTVTSSIADQSTIYFTLAIEPKNEEARAFLEENPVSSYGSDSQLHVKGSILGDTSGGAGIGYNEETGMVEADIHCRLLPWPLSRNISIRFDAMEKGLWLKLPVHRISSVKLKINATAPGAPNDHGPEGGPVTVETIVLSPMSMTVKSSTPVDSIGRPVFYFLWQDGSVTTPGQLHLRYPSGSGTFGEEAYTSKMTWKFGTIQDLTKLEAVIFGNMAYPLDGGAPYAFDSSGLPFPFAVRTIGEDLLPLFTLCDNLKIPYDWDEETRTVTMSYRGITAAVTEGDPVIRLEGAEWTTDEADIPAVFQDGELWADASSVLYAWDVMTNWIFETDKDGNRSDSRPGYAIIP